MFASYSVRRAHGYHQPNHYHQPQQPMLVCQGCGFSTRHSALLDRHRRHCFRSNRAAVKADASSGTASKPQTASSGVVQQRRATLPAPSVCRNYKCDKCAFVTNRAKLFLYHQNCIHGENINVYGCDKCEYASRHKNKVLRHQRLVHKIHSSELNDSTTDFRNPSIVKTSPLTPSPSQQQQTSPNLQMKFDENGDDDPLDLSASEETSGETTAAEIAAEVSIIRETPVHDERSDSRAEPYSSTPVSSHGAVNTSKPEVVKEDEIDNDERANVGIEIAPANVISASEAAPSNATANLMLNFGVDETTGSNGMPTASLLRCRYCRYTNRHKWKMASHVRASHSAGRPVYRCPECPRFATDSRVEWSAHRSRHSGKAMFECPECAYATTMKRNYERHLERHRAGGPRRCGLCSYSSTGEGAIQRHMAEYHPPSPNRPLPPLGDDAPLGVVPDITAYRAQQPAHTVPSGISVNDVIIGNEPMGIERIAMVSPGTATFVETGSSSRFRAGSSLSLNGSQNLRLTSLIVRTPATGKPITSTTDTAPVVELHGDDLSPSTSIGRCVCPLCPLSYKRPADLNRHMKQKHETTLKDFVVRNRLDRGTSDRSGSLIRPLPASSSPSPNLSIRDGISPIPPFPAAARGSILSLVSPDASEESTPDVPINLSLKDVIDVKPAPIVAPSKLVKSPSCDQNEPLDLSFCVIGGFGKAGRDRLNSTIVVSSPAFSPVVALPLAQTSVLLSSNPVVTVESNGTIGDSLVRTNAGYPCGRCSYVSKRASDLRRHQLVHSASTKRYRCPHCPIDRSYKLQFDLGRHLARAHGHLSTSSRHVTASSKRHARNGSSLIELPAVPDVVSERRTSTKVFETASWSTTTGTGKNHLACPYCQYVGKSLGELERHARLHSGEKPHRCPLCSFSTIWKSDMKIHLQKLHRDGLAALGDFDELLDRICRNVPIVVDASIITTGNDVMKSDVLVNGTSIVSVDYNMNVETTDSEKTAAERSVSLETSFSAARRQDDQEFRQVPEAQTGSSEKPRGRCPLCPFQCQTPSEMSFHLESHESKAAVVTPTAVQFTCVRCWLKFSSRSAARNHVVLEHSEIPDPDRVIVEKNADDQPIPAAPLPARRRNQDCSPGDGTATATNADAVAAAGFSKLIQADGDNDLMLVNDVEKLAEQYANVVADMLYGNENSSSASSMPAINQLCRYAAAGPSLSTDSADGSLQALSNSRSTTSSPFGLVAGSLKQNRSPNASSMTASTAARFRPYKCSQCGKRSNWRWDLKKHIRASRHPHAEVVVMSDREARESFHEIADQMYQKRSGLVLHSAETSFNRSACGPHTNSKAEPVVRHTESSHPASSQPIASSNNLGVLSTSTTATTTSSIVEKCETVNLAPEERALYTVDRQKLKRLHCSACPYRSNFRSDVGRHIRHKHPNVGARIEVMSSAEAAATLTNYLDTWARKKFVLSPTKLYASSVERQRKNIEDERVSTPVTPPTSGNFVSHCSTPATLPADGAVKPEDETLSWKCAACDFTAPRKEAVVEHWEKWHRGDGTSASLEGGTIPSSSSGAAVVAVSNVHPSSSSSGESVFRKRASSSVGGVFGGKSLQCDICPYRTKKLGLLTIHKTYHRPQLKNSHKCPFCPYYVCAPRLLHQHVRIHSGTSSLSLNRVQTLPSERSTVSVVVRQPLYNRDDANRTLYSCTSCPYIGNNRNDFIYHRQFHRPRPSAPFKCEKCPFWVGQRRLLTQHRRIHGQSYRMRREQYLTGTSTSVQHDNSNVDDQRAASREDDVISLENRSGLDAVEFVEDDATTETAVNLSTNGCVSTAPSNDDRRTAGAQRRVQRTIWRCDRCPYATAKRSQLETHRQLHGSRQRHTCDRCDYSVSGVHLLLQHVRLHENGTGSTDESKRGGDSSTTQRHHHHHQQQQQQLPQSKDDDRDVTKSVLTVDEHSPLLSTSRPLYRCDKCPYANARRDHLLCHARFHSGAGPLMCPHCDYSVSKVHLLTQHIRVHGQPASGSVIVASMLETASPDGGRLSSLAAVAEAVSSPTTIEANPSTCNKSQVAVVASPCRSEKMLSLIGRLPSAESAKVQFMMSLELKTI